MLKKLFPVFLLLALIAPGARGQYNGSVSLATVNTTIANGATCTGSAQNFITGTLQGFDNLGQTSHLATATSNASAFQMEIDGIDKLGNVFRLSDLQLGVPSSAKGGLVVTASGYMPRIQISVTCTAAATFSVSYSGSFSPQPPNFAGALLTAVEKLPFQTAAANATGSVTFQTPNGNSQGTIVFQYSATGPAGSTITAQCVTNSSINLQSFVYNLTTVATPQFFAVTASSCPFVTLTYTSGGASAVTYNMEYFFNVSGTQQTLNTANSGPSSTIPLQVISDSISQAFVSQGQVVNPTANQPVVQVSANNGSRILYFDRVTVSCSAACQPIVVNTVNNGTSCTAATPRNLSLGSTVTSTALGQTSSCVANPTSSTTIMYIFDVAANTPTVLDLRGLIAPANTQNGLEIASNNSLTGVMRATMLWYEK
jgi:hypothetical protein